jgi:hypothetical protein
MNEEVTLREIEYEYDCMLDLSNGPIKIGDYEFSPSTVLKNCDPTAYHQEVINFIDQLLQDDELYEFNHKFFREPAEIIYVLRKLEIAKY